MKSPSSKKIVDKDGARENEQSNSFNTLSFMKTARHPSEGESDVPNTHHLIKPHIDSFNSIFDSGLLDKCINNISAKEVIDAEGNRLCFWIDDVQVGKSLLSEKEITSINRSLLPAECRERGISYKGKITAKLCYSINGGPVVEQIKALGGLPIMVKSSLCHLEDLSPAQLVAKKEESEELGGYFIVNGIERIIRLLIATRRNYPLILNRPSLAKRGPLYSEYGLQIRCVRDDESSQSVYIHYLLNGGAMMRVHVKKAEYLIPLMLIVKALIPTNDREIMDSILHGDHNTFVSSRVEGMLRDFNKEKLFTQHQCLEYLGERMMTIMNLPSDASKVQIGSEFIRQYILVHLNDNLDKFNLVMLMMRKLYAVVSGECCPDNPDSPMNHEVLLGGQVYLNYMKEKLDDWVSGIKISIEGDLRKSPESVVLVANSNYLKKCFAKTVVDVGKKMEYFLATGNLVSSTGMDLSQTSGYTIVAEKLNHLRYISHFRSIHRGAFFAELKTTTVRKLMPESWGFLCPVHTPDGTPCGLLNHLSKSCHIVTPDSATADAEGNDEAAENIIKHLINYGISPNSRNAKKPSKTSPVMLDGRWIGNISGDFIAPLAHHLRILKAEKGINEMVEVVYIPPSNGGLFAGLYLFSGAARMMRAVKMIDQDCKKVFIGTMEQVYLDIAVKPDEVVPGLTQFIEYDPTEIMSVVANLTPFPDLNQSPRNMYQCQMGKQTMGTPAHNYVHRTDNKLYRLMNPQSPIVRTETHGDYGMDHFPSGTNAIVAVLSYTGYDMEDAMILNKSAYERGFGHGVMYKSEFYDISDRNLRGEVKSHFFSVGGKSRDESLSQSSTLEVDGLPAVGQKLSPGDALFSVHDEATGSVRIEKFKGFEDAYVEQVRLLGNENGSGPLQKVNIKFRIPRNPIIGDKFSSRHGQKGVCSQKYPLVDMPWTESGMTPDIIINPHAFPSRMTIGMFVESMAAKAGALHGLAQDSTPFRFGEQHTAADHFGEQLKEAGYNYWGNEAMYSGITGVEMKADIYIGIVYYQRLRHMVSDKFQVRTTGPVHNLTQQPVKGRKRAGGVRFGEMERDSLLAHGASFLLQDRLLNCSDYSKSLVCRRCGSILSPVADGAGGRAHCLICKRSDALDVIAIPFVFRYLCAELIAMNIDLRLQIK